MKRITKWVLAATLFSGATMLTSCKNDNPVELPQENTTTTIYDEDPTLRAKEIVGTWTADSIVSGTTASGKAYTRMVQALTLNADGTGHGATFFFFDDDQLVDMFGGQYIAPFKYQVDAKGKISLSFSGDYPPDVDRLKVMSFTCENGVVQATDGGKIYTMHKAGPDLIYELERLDLIANGGDDSNYNKSVIENEGQLYTHSHSFTLNNHIDTYGWSGTEDWLKASGSISLDLRVVPLYVQSSNGDQAGDYYFVKCAVTPHNNSLWQAYKENHGLSQIRIYGYWFKDMDIEVKLVNEDGSDVDGLQYFQRPLPENKNDSKNYVNGTSTSIGASCSFGASEKGPTGSYGFSFGKTWTSSTSYQLETISFTRDSSTPTVKYNYYSENVKLSDDWDDYGSNFPSACRKEFTGNLCWVWFVPRGKAGVDDGSKNKFRIKANVKANYSSWYHWRAAVEYDSNRRDHDVSFDTDDLIDAPDRTPWGVIALRNASNNQMAHVRFYKQGDDLSGNPVAQLTDSYSKDKQAKQTLVEGTYTVTFELYDGNSNEKLSSWKIENVKVHQGKDETSATTEITTIDAVKME